MQEDNKKIKVHVVQHPTVNWMNPFQLIDTGLRAVLGGLFGAYADRREVQAALGANDMLEDDIYLDYRSADELWVDYIADTGDGWNATYSLAWLLAQTELTVENCEQPLKRGQILVMGGDQVYPVASRTAYSERMVGPYQAALPYSNKQAPEILAIPGNHDWYDGLTGFLRLFCQSRWIGGRKTMQNRSYFAVELPHEWWLWGVDIQLESDVDIAQAEYFKYFAKKLTSTDRVILCSPKPTWVEAGDTRLSSKERHEAYLGIQYLEKLITNQGAQVTFMLSGDLHHYAHFHSLSNASHKITAGGGGAFLLGTHELPNELLIDGAAQPMQLDLIQVNPPKVVSRKLRWHNVWFSWHNPAFAVFLAALYSFYAWIWQSSSEFTTKTCSFNVSGCTQTVMENWATLEFAPSNFSRILFEFWSILAHQPTTLGLTALPIVGLILFATGTHNASLPKQMLWGALHGCCHIILAVTLLWIIAKINIGWVYPHLNLNNTGIPVQKWLHSLWQIGLFTVQSLLFGFFAGGLLFGLYLIVSNMVARMHADEVFSALHNPNFKNFLRIHITADHLSLYAIKVDQVCTDWTISPHVTVLEQRKRWPFIKEWLLEVEEKNETPWFVPDGIEIKAALIEVIRIPNSPKIKTNTHEEGDDHEHL